MPTTVNMARNIRKEPARYISWLCRADINIGPVVGSERTIETIADPETICGSILPISAINGFNEVRSGYFISAFMGCNPLALAVNTYCF